MLNNRKQVRVQGRSFPRRGGLIIYFRDEPNGGKGQVKGFRPPEGEDPQSLE